MKRKIMIHLLLSIFAPFFFSCQSTAISGEGETAAHVYASPAGIPEQTPRIAEYPPAPPLLEVSLSSEYFNSYGEEDRLEIKISLAYGVPIREWKVQIMEPLPSLAVFNEWSGQGAPPQSLPWDGSGLPGRVPLSASTYPLRVVVISENGNESVHESGIRVGMIVIRESAASMRIRVPSVKFAPSSSSLTAGLSPADIANNYAVLREVALTLNDRFAGYRVRVEGHTNFPAGQQGSQTLLNLGNQRARSVVDYLVGLGVNRIRLSTVGIGGALPIASPTDPQSSWKNYRVDFVILNW